MSEEPNPPTYKELAREVLLYRMRDYSEDFYAAGWMDGLEFTLWHTQPDEDDFFSHPVDPKARNEMHALAKIAGGWWVYEDKTVPNKSGPVFVTMERWMQILEDSKGPQTEGH